MLDLEEKVAGVRDDMAIMVNACLNKVVELKGPDSNGWLMVSG